MDEFTKREDRVAKAGLDAIMREYAFELAKEPAYNKNVKGNNRSGLPNYSLNPLSATYNLQQMTISTFAAFSKITNKA